MKHVSCGLALTILGLGTIGPTQTGAQKKSATPAIPFNPDTTPLALPPVGAHWLRAVSPTRLELTYIATKQSDSTVEEWNWVDEQNHLRLSGKSAFKVLCNG